MVWLIERVREQLADGTPADEIAASRTKRLRRRWHRICGRVSRWLRPSLGSVLHIPEVVEVPIRLACWRRLTIRASYVAHRTRWRIGPGDLKAVLDDA